MTTLREARKKGEMDKFIKEHEQETPGDLDKLDAALKRPASGKSSKPPKASSRDGSDD